MSARPLLTLGLLLGLVLGGYIWVALGHTTPAASAPNPADASARPAAPKTPAPFLPTHTPAKSFAPDQSNVTPRMHAELERLRQTVKNAPDDADAHLRLARLLHDGHQEAEAVTHYEHYVALRPEDRQAWLDLAQSYGTLERWDDAQVAMETLLAHTPDDPAAMYNLGAIHANQNRFDEARRWWEPVAEQTEQPAMQRMARTALGRLPHQHP